MYLKNGYRIVGALLEAHSAILLMERFFSSTTLEKAKQLNLHGYKTIFFALRLPISERTEMVLSFYHNHHDR